jgi:hypothetical protein
MLSVSDILQLRLNASLVTLSACNTGLGPVDETGVDNIVDAFIQAGTIYMPGYAINEGMFQIQDGWQDKSVTALPFPSGATVPSASLTVTREVLTDPFVPLSTYVDDQLKKLAKTCPGFHVDRPGTWMAIQQNCSTSTGRHRKAFTFASCWFRSFGMPSR